MAIPDDDPQSDFPLTIDLTQPLFSAGEFVEMNERIVISPAVGRVEFPSEVQVGTVINVGDKVAVVGGELVCSAFSGRLMGVLALDGQRITTGQALAWLAPADDQPEAMTS
jgi:biotin carboxyl carrier protein